MRDFTITVYTRFLDQMKESNYCFQTFSEFLEAPGRRSLILRHDVDRLPENSLRFARIEAEREIRGTYFFRTVPQSFDEEIISEIARLGHEIGYHYEDLVPASKKVKVKSKKSERDDNSEREISSLAIESFKTNLVSLRKLAPVTTICMHGSPLSRWDSRVLWKYYDYHTFGLKGEPYFDIDFSDVLYLTDTGRRWDGDAFNVRDKAVYNTSFGDNAGEPAHLKVHSTFDIISAVKKDYLPSRMMITFHPQRWNDNIMPWISELLGQNIKNTAKYFLLKIREAGGKV